MSALVGILLGLAGVGYAILPLLSGRGIPALASELPEGRSPADLDAEAAVLRAWSVAAGELENDDGPAAAGAPAEGA